MASSTSKTRRTSPSGSLVGALALLGVAVLVGSAHSWITPVVLRPDWSGNKGSSLPAAGQIGDAGSSAQSPAFDPGTPDAEHIDPAGNHDGQVEDDGHYIGLTTAKRLFDDEGALFIDARPREEYDLARVAGAVYLTSELVSSGKAQDTISELVQNYGFDYPIVIYCHGGDCDASDNVAKLLLPMGFNNLRVMKAGFDDWKSAGYEVE